MEFMFIYYNVLFVISLICAIYFLYQNIRYKGSAYPIWISIAFMNIFNLYLNFICNIPGG